MRNGELLEEVKSFQQGLKKHWELWRRSLGPASPNYPVRNLEELRRQATELSHTMARLRLYLEDFRADWMMLNRSTGVRWNSLEAATDFDQIAPIKGSSIESIVPILDQFIGVLRARDPDSEVGASSPQPTRTAESSTVEMAKAMLERYRVFFAAPVDESYRWIRKAAAAACRQLDIEFWAMDEIVRPGEPIVETVPFEISQATIGLAVVSGMTPDVMYELGILHQASKPTVILSDHETVDKIPFDLRGRLLVRYDAAARNESELTTVIRDAARSVIALFDPAARAAVAAGQAAPIWPTALRSAQLSLTAIDFERVKTSAAKAIGRKYCQIQDMSDYNDGAVQGWRMRARCSGGSAMSVIIDLNGVIRAIEGS